MGNTKQKVMAKLRFNSHLSAIKPSIRFHKLENVNARDGQAA